MFCIKFHSTHTIKKIRILKLLPLSLFLLLLHSHLYSYIVPEQTPTSHITGLTVRKCVNFIHNLLPLPCVTGTGLDLKVHVIPMTHSIGVRISRHIGKWNLLFDLFASCADITIQSTRKGPPPALAWEGRSLNSIHCFLQPTFSAPHRTNRCFLLVLHIK